MNYEATCVPNQRGAVLIFSLIMLLLLTLVSVSMIQHNKQELAMTGNTLEQTRSLARAETELKLAEQLIDKTRLKDDPLDDPVELHTCDISNLINENQTILTTATGTGTATVTAVYCIADKTETQCNFTDVDGDGTVERNDTAACMCLHGTEIYSIKLEFTGDSNYGAQRTVESKYAVDCSDGQI